MRKIEAPAASRQLQPASGKTSQPARLSTSGPQILNPRTDIEIPLSAWSAWKPADGTPRQLRRALTAEERQDLEARRDELAPMVAPYGVRERDEVVLALSDMYGGYTSMRQGDEAAVARLDSVLRLLSGFPAWAIVKACRGIQMNGVWREGKLDKRWPPNDPEIIHAVQFETQLYAGQHKSACDLLGATVEEA